jgi:hypothetical protein
MIALWSCNDRLRPEAKLAEYLSGFRQLAAAFHRFFQGLWAHIRPDLGYVPETLLFGSAEADA